MACVSTMLHLCDMHTYAYRPIRELTAHERAKQERADLTRDIFFALIAKTESHEADVREDMAYEAKELAAILLDGDEVKPASEL